MSKGRMEAFSDGVLAIILTIMVLELKVPHGDSLEVLKPLLPVFLSYILSFIYIGIYWNNHHHMMQAVQQINGTILWANIHLLFWLSLVPFVTGWMGENHFSQWPVATYGGVLFMAGVAYYLLEQCLINSTDKNATLSKAIGSDKKGIASIIIYAFGIALCFINPWIAFGLYVVVACIWFIPDKRVEKKLTQND